jgi:hypothetical protein
MKEIVRKGGIPIMRWENKKAYMNDQSHIARSVLKVG